MEPAFGVERDRAALVQGSFDGVQSGQAGNHRHPAVDRVIGRHRFGDGHDERYGERVPGNACPRPAEPSSGVVHGTGGDHGDGDAAVIVAREPPPLDESACLRMGGIDAFIGGHLVRRFRSPVKSRRCDFV